MLPWEFDAHNDEIDGRKVAWRYVLALASATLHYFTDVSQSFYILLEGGGGGLSQPSLVV